MFSKIKRILSILQDFKKEFELDLWQRKYVKLKAYWASGTAEFTPISANIEKFALFAIMIKLYIDNHIVLLVVLPIAILLYNAIKLTLGYWRERAMLWHYENEFIGNRFPHLTRIEEKLDKLLKQKKENA